MFGGRRPSALLRAGCHGEFGLTRDGDAGQLLAFQAEAGRTRLLLAQAEQASAVDRAAFAVERLHQNVRSGQQIGQVAAGQSDGALCTNFSRVGADLNSPLGTFIAGAGFDFRCDLDQGMDGVGVVD